MAELLSSAWKGCTGAVSSISNIFQPSKIEQIIIREVEMNPVGASRAFLRLAGISGATAICLGAYGSHAFLNKPDVDQRLKNTFEIANKYHFLHSLALLSIPMTKKPMLTGALMTSGMVLFCGSCYYHALTENTAIRQVTPYGGFLLIFAWLSMAL